WHMGNDGKPRPGYDRWVSFDGHGRIVDPVFNVDGEYVKQKGYISDLLNDLAVESVGVRRRKPWSLFLAHKAVHPDAEQAADGTATMIGYVPAERHRGLYEGAVFPRKPNMLAPEQVVRDKPAWAEAMQLRRSDRSRAFLEILGSGGQEEIRERARMMASVDEGVGRILEALERTGQLDDTAILFLGDNGYFFGEHGLGPDRRFAYEEGIRSPFVLRYPRRVKAGTRLRHLVICQDIAPTLIELAGGRPGPHVQGRSLLPLLSGRRVPWRKSVLVEYWAENAMPWLVGMTYRAVRTDRYKYIRWINRGRDSELDELYDLEKDPFELKNLAGRRESAALQRRLRRELGKLTLAALGL
ncbi:MAG TPA: sulfatase/phosphatase domain-containing protein, partial [Burkholderiales bacterium]|nr:sulfatase/phosphatase domain-containing protein [Burkholderiales bacterium]